MRSAPPVRLQPSIRHFTDATDILFTIGIAKTGSLHNPWRTLSPSSRYVLTPVYVTPPPAPPRRLIYRNQRGGKPQHNTTMTVVLFALLRSSGWLCQTTFSSCRAIIYLPVIARTPMREMAANQGIQFQFDALNSDGAAVAWLTGSCTIPDLRSHYSGDR